MVEFRLLHISTETYGYGFVFVSKFQFLEAVATLAKSHRSVRESGKSPNATAQRVQMTHTATPHDASTCPYCRNDVLPQQEPDHRHVYDSAIGASCFPDDVAGSTVLMLQCECGHTREFLGIIHPEPIADNPYLSALEGAKCEQRPYSDFLLGKWDFQPCGEMVSVHPRDSSNDKPCILERGHKGHCSLRERELDGAE
jgi:hypothetical protein